MSVQIILRLSETLLQNFQFLMKPVLVFLCVLLLFIQCNNDQSFNNRKYISLNGSWELEESYSSEAVPTSFSRTIIVPGIADMAKPAFDSIGYNLSGNRYLWYKKNFVLQEEFPVVRLKINKAKFGTKVYVNGEVAGSRLYCFTPTVFEIQDYLKEPGARNEILIRIGADPKVLPDTIPYGHDFEKLKYLPGIYDDVKLICSEGPYIENIQIAPDIDKEEINVQVTLRETSGIDELKLSYKINKDSSGDLVADGSYIPGSLSTNNLSVVTFRIPVPDARLWSPEDPFLYNLHLSTGFDNISERFGMRTFRMVPETGRAYLNGKPYFMRGTNVCIFRFFEDPQREFLPWDEQWVRNLHQKFKSLHWNSIRYCIGYPPKKWYDIADEEGFLIQNEYPLWGNEKITQHALTEAYGAAMKEHWNHPCVVIWDAQNETFTKASGEAIQNVRALDLSDRPWDNGWAPPQEITDAIETHPYVFSKYRRPEHTPPKEYLHEFLAEPRIPDNGPNQRSPKDHGRYENAIIINEYAWLWLNRNGTPTTLTDNVYKELMGTEVSKEERLEFYAHHLGMLTEYWRGHRKCAGVLHFCGLGYSRPEHPRGQTSDNFIDIKNLTFEPHFLKYAKPAFSPVGLMIDYWIQYPGSGSMVNIPVNIINDTNNDYSGQIHLSIEREGKIIMKENENVQVEKQGRTTRDFLLEIPKEPGQYLLIAEINYNGHPVKSIRKISVEEEN